MIEPSGPHRLHPRFDGVTLSDLALACTMFNSLTSYNESLSALKEQTDCQLDLANPEHRTRLLKWLNDWGCRHLAREQHELASTSILEWYEEEGSCLMQGTKPLWRLDNDELAQASTAYGALKDRIGALGTRKGKDRVVTIGPTAASKILFALRPEAFAPWDVAMRKAFDCDGSAKSYLRFLGIVRGLTLHVAIPCNKNGFTIEHLPYELGRPDSTVVSLINEYLWVTVSAGCTLPDGPTLTRWAGW